ncbi:hypothetical protein KKA14_01015 [bacterium]|nr:hypothetical protein [bacterium]
MSDSPNDNAAGTKAQEEIIGRMIKLAEKYSDKPTSEINEKIRAVLISPAITKSGFLKDLEKLNAADRWNQVFKAITIIIKELEIEEDDDILDEATHLYLSWLSKQVKMTPSS